tara:strand:+ start:4128 stop:4619 length:492 start_codon:yes stop_codon:yes gene_type:complete
VNEADLLVKEARSWIGTPFHHQGRMKKVGCDCIGMVLGVIHSVGLHSRFRDNRGNLRPFTAFDQTDYAPDPNSAQLKETLDSHLDPISLEGLQAGDVLLFRIVRLPQHVGIVANHPYGGLSLIHAYAPARRVVEETLSPSWLTRTIGAYRFPQECFEGIVWHP